MAEALKNVKPRRRFCILEIILSLTEKTKKSHNRKLWNIKINAGFQENSVQLIPSSSVQFKKEKYITRPKILET